MVDQSFNLFLFSRLIRNHRFLSNRLIVPIVNISCTCTGYAILLKIKRSFPLLLIISSSLTLILTEVLLILSPKFWTRSLSLIDVPVFFIAVPALWKAPLVFVPIALTFSLSLYTNWSMPTHINELTWCWRQLTRLHWMLFSLLRWGSSWSSGNFRSLLFSFSSQQSLNQFYETYTKNRFKKKFCTFKSGTFLTLVFPSICYP